MVSLSCVQLKSCSNLQNNQKAVNNTVNQSVSSHFVPNFKANSHHALAAMGKAQVSMNKSKVAFKGGVLTIGMTEAEIAARKVRKAAEKAAKKAADEEFYRTHESWMTYDGYIQWSEK